MILVQLLALLLVVSVVVVVVAIQLPDDFFRRESNRDTVLYSTLYQVAKIKKTHVQSQYRKWFSCYLVFLLHVFYFRQYYGFANNSMSIYSTSLLPGTCSSLNVSPKGTVQVI
jgi:hypothetical protein